MELKKMAVAAALTVAMAVPAFARRILRRARRRSSSSEPNGCIIIGTAAFGPVKWQPA